MPCSCGNTNCPCGIPCYCSEESCKCQTCAIAFPRFCNICNKPLITEIQTDEEKCSCFIRESTALILGSRSNLPNRMGNIPMPFGYFVSGKLMVNVMIPVPVFQQFIPPKPVCSIPSLPSIPIDSRNVLPSCNSDEDSAIFLCPKRNSGLLSTAELNQIVDKFNEQSNIHPSTSISLNGEQNTKISCNEACSPPKFSQSRDENQNVNIVQDTKLKAKKPDGELSTSELHKLLDKSSGQSSNHFSSSIHSNEKQNTKLYFDKTCSPAGLSQPTDENQKVNIVQNTKLEIEDRTTVQEPSSFYLPSIMIDNISHPVGLADPIWRLSNPAFRLEGTSDSSLKLYNPFYVSGQDTTTETMATYEKDHCLPALGINFTGNNKQCFTKKVDKNAQTDSAISLQINERPSEPMKISEQSNRVINGEYREIAISSNITVENESPVLPSSINSNTIALPEKVEMTANSIPDQKSLAISTEVSTSGVQTQPLCVASTSASSKNNCLQACPTNEFALQTLNNVSTESHNEKWQELAWWSPLPAFSLPTTSITQIIPEHSGNSSSTSNFQRLLTTCNYANSVENASLPTDHASFVSEMNRRNVENSELNNSIPLYLDPRTTQKMEKLLKSALQLNVSARNHSDSTVRN